MTELCEPSPIDQQDMPRVVAELQAQAQAQIDEKHVKTLVEINTKTFDRATTYANVILVSGYVGGFTIWSFTRAQLPVKASVAVALALLVSLAAFVIFEVVKMTITSGIVFRNAAALHRSSTSAEKLQAIKELETAHAAVLMKFRWYWAVTMVVAVGGALIALALLAWNFAALLMGWPN